MRKYFALKPAPTAPLSMSKEFKSPVLKLPAPPEARVATVIDDYHGHRIADPYRWLEDATAAETRRFVAEQNVYTRSLLEGIPGRDNLRRRVEQLLTIGRVASPRIGGNR